MWARTGPFARWMFAEISKCGFFSKGKEGGGHCIQLIYHVFTWNENHYINVVRKRKHRNVDFLCCLWH